MERRDSTGTEKKLGELLLDMGFVSPTELQRGLDYARKNKVKLGEALAELGILDKDHVYWVLGAQLKINYMDLTPDTIDTELIAIFPFEAMLKDSFIPLYQVESALHIAVSDPGDHLLLERIEALVPERRLVFHLALPEKINDMLEFTRHHASENGEDQAQDSPSGQQTLSDIPSQSSIMRSIDSSLTPSARRAIAQYWDQMVDILMELKTDDIVWLYESADDCQMLQRRHGSFIPLMRFPINLYHEIHERMEDETAMAGLWDEARWLLIENRAGEAAAFKMWQMDCLDQHITWLQRLPTFSRRELFRKVPQAPSLIEELRHLFGEHRRLIIGGKDAHLAKQCFYYLLQTTLDQCAFPPPFFIERDAKMYFPNVAQLTQYEYSLIKFLENFEGEHTPFVFYETEYSEILGEDEILNKFWSGRWENLALFIPFDTIGEMREELNSQPGWRQGGFQALYFHNRYLKTL